ncbi:MAG: gephyrin-like molybdotransferase Glp [Pseudomonadota bacterium]|nr:gephyrin-like molybdotransferase Glp [Pseudomonadota bacterium]
MALLELDTALARMLDDLAPIPRTERIGLADALGRVLAEAPVARTAVPPFPNSAMDGYAVRADDPIHDTGNHLRVVETIFAGRAPTCEIGPGECARIFTGAPVPVGADAVIAQEDAVVEAAGVRFEERPIRGRFVRDAGGDVHIGERLLDLGSRLHAGSIALLAAAGVANVLVRAAPRVAVIATGDELRPPDAELAPGEIHDSSTFAIPAAAATLPVRVTLVMRAGDTPEALAQALDQAAVEADAIITTGGVSVGDADHVRAVLEGAGQIEFWRLALKPGRPFAYGRYRDVPLFGLPGNPVSSMVTFLLLVRAGLLRLSGANQLDLPRQRLRLAAPLRKATGRRDFQRAQREVDGRARAFERQDSNILSVLAQADLLLDLPADASDLDANAEVSAIDLAGLLGQR